MNMYFANQQEDGEGRKEDNLWSLILEHPPLQEKSKETEYTEYLTEDLDEIELL